MSDWKNLFSNTMLVRGKSLSGATLSKFVVLQRDDGCTAFSGRVIDGTETFAASAILNKDNEVVNVHCSCQYHKKSTYCKHIAAILYRATEKKEDALPEKKDKKEVEKKLKYSEIPFKDDYKAHFLSFGDTLKLYMPLKETLSRAEKIFEERGVRSINIAVPDHGEKYIAYSAYVDDDKNQTRKVTIKLGRNGITGISCEDSYAWYSSRKLTKEENCNKTAINEYGVHELCVHKTAALLSLVNYIEEDRDYLDYTDKKAERLIEGFRKETTVIEKKSEGRKYPVDIETSIVPDLDDGGIKAELRISVDGGKYYKIKDVLKLSSAVRGKSTLSLSTSCTADFSRAELTPRSEAAINLIAFAENHYNRNSGSYYTKYSWKRSEIKISRFLDEFYSLMDGQSVLHGERPVLAFKETESSLDVLVEPVVEKGEVVAVSVSGRITGRYNGENYIYWFEGDEFRRAEKRRLGSAVSLIDVADDNGRFSFNVGRKYLDNFYQRVLPDIKRHGRVEDNAVDMLHGILKEAPKTVLYIDTERDGCITCRAVMSYEGNTLSVYPAWYASLNRGKYQSYLLDIAETLDNFFNRKIYGQDLWKAASTDEEKYDFLQNRLPLLMEIGEVRVSDTVKKLIIRPMPSVSSFVDIDEKDDSILNLTIDLKGLTIDELVEILQSYRDRKKFHRLKNGDFISLEETSLDALCDIFLSSGLSLKDFTDGRMHLPLYRALYLDQILKEQNDITYEGGQKLRRLIKEFKTINESDYEVPSSLESVMRSYQKDGYRWMRVLFDHGFGGILADDMGLGKTLQALSLLLSLKEEGKSVNTLIVTPASLVYNWKAEVGKFTPSLKAVTVTGTSKEREEIIKKSSDYDILITSYDLLKRDIALYSGSSFNIEIIDEAQFIKNHTTAAAKAVRAVKAKHRLALTGTPIENRLSELWSIFEFLMPGFLFSHESFKKLLATPIEKNGDKEASLRLKKLTGPFILRRLKTDVLKDLPEKTEETRVTPLEGEQLKLYTAEVLKAKGMLKGNKNYNESKIEILAELMRIREICCDPSLVFDDYKGESAKREAVMDLIVSAIDGGHKILLFSQFTSMLALLEKDLEREGIEYYKITGETGKAKRLELVDAFNSGTVPLFLISLKAGGTGLNLTAADIVIHYDPWWNTAVQNQATDRAHRIGQTKRVTVYRMIAENTIEEKIMKLQETKKNLADEIVSSDNISLSNLTQEDLMELLSISNMG